MTEATELAANAIIHLRAINGDGKMLDSLDLLQKSLEAIANAEKLLSRGRSAKIS